MTFELHPNLVAKIFVVDLPLCRVLLEDECHYPWIFLVPRRSNSSRLMDLAVEDQVQLMKELDLSQKILWDLFHPKQLNVAAIGNKTPQLHIHIIARNLDDPAWPGTVWDHPVRKKYSADERDSIAEKLKAAFASFL